MSCSGSLRIIDYGKIEADYVGLHRQGVGSF